MAFYNPQRVSFNPNASVIKSAGAVGDYLQQKANLDYKKQINARDYQFLRDKYVKGNQQWQDNFDQKAQALKDTNAYRTQTLANHATDAAATNDFRNKELGLKKTLYDNTNKKYDAKIAADKLKAEQLHNQQIIKGGYILNTNPNAKNLIHGTTTQETHNPYVQMAAGKNPNQDFLLNYQYPQTVNEHTTYSQDDLANLGASGIPMATGNESGGFAFQKLVTAYEKETDPEKKQWYKDRIVKETQADMNSNKINWNAVQSDGGQFAAKLGLPSMYHLATYDMSKLTPVQQAEASTLGDKMFKVYGADNKQITKKLATIGAEYEQLNYAQNALAKVSDIRFVDEFTKKVFSNYFGLSTKELASTNAIQAAQSALNIVIKADAGGNVTNGEALRKELETFNSYQHKDKIIAGMKNMARRKIGVLNGLKSIQPLAFNLKYGRTLQNWQNLYNALDGNGGKNSNDFQEVANPTQRTSQTITVDDAQKYGISFE